MVLPYKTEIRFRAPFFLFLDVSDGYKRVPLKYCTNVIAKVLLPDLPVGLVSELEGLEILSVCHFSNRIHCLPTEPNITLTKLLDKHEEGGYTNYMDEDGDICALCTDRIKVLLGEIAENIYIHIKLC